MSAIITERKFNVPVPVLFAAFSNPEQLKQWWGPHGFTNTFYDFNFSNGGKWHFTMHGPDGKVYDNESEFVSVKENEQVVLHHISKPEYTAVFKFSVVENNISFLRWEMTFATEKAHESLKDFVAEKNIENLDRLEQLLNKQTDAVK